MIALGSGLALWAHTLAAVIPIFGVGFRDAVDVGLLRFEFSVGVIFAPDAVPLIFPIGLALHQTAHFDFVSGIMLLIEYDVRGEPVPTEPCQPYAREDEQRGEPFQLGSKGHEPEAAAGRRSIG